MLYFGKFVLKHSKLLEEIRFHVFGWFLPQDYESTKVSDLVL